MNFDCSYLRNLKDIFHSHCSGNRVDDSTLPDTIRVKAMFRRSKALFELGNYFRAAQDAGECQINQPSETFKAHLDRVRQGRNVVGI